MDSEPVYNKKNLKTKIESHGDEVTNFCNKKIPKVDSNPTCLAVINLDSALKKDENYYPQVFLKECKYTDKKVVRHLNSNLNDFFLLISLIKNKFGCSKPFIFKQKGHKKSIGLLKFLHIHIYSNYNFKRAVLQNTRLKSLSN